MPIVRKRDMRSQLRLKRRIGGPPFPGLHLVNYASINFSSPLLKTAGEQQERSRLVPALLAQRYQLVTVADTGKNWRGAHLNFF
jgi:hypothetical protein